MAQATAQGHGDHAGGHDHTGGHPPTSLGLNSRKIGMWAFLSSEVMFFTALIATYLVLKPRNIAQGGPPPHDYFDLLLVSTLAFILLLSSVTMVLAVAATERDDRRKERIWLGATMLLGLIFLGGQVYEFNKMFGEEFVTVTITEPNGRVERVGIVEHHLEDELAVLQREHPDAQISQSSPRPTTWTTSLFGTSFFTLTGFHGTHVGIGVLWLGIVLVMSLRGAITSRNSLTVEMAGLYWHFVDLVWVAIFTLIYLI
jgi:cytochrome c oxidase subunit III